LKLQLHWDGCLMMSSRDATRIEVAGKCIRHRIQIGIEIACRKRRNSCDGISRKHRLQRRIEINHSQTGRCRHQGSQPCMIEFDQS